MNRYMNINAGLAEAVLREGLADEFRVLLGLKMTARGNGSYFTLSSRVKESLRGLCGWKCKRTAERKIQRLKEIGWIGVDKQGRHYVRSFGYLLNSFDVKTDTVHQIGVPFCVESKRKMKATLFSIATGKIIANRQFALVRQNATHISTGTGHSYNPGKGESYSPSDLSVSFLAARFEKSKATIHRWKHEAMREGMLERKKRVFKFPGTTNVSAIESAFPNEAYRTYLSFEEGCVVVQLTDSLDVGLKYKSRQQ